MSALWVPARLALVTGSRDWPNTFRHARIIQRAIAEYAPNLTLHGNARGADTIAHAFADYFPGSVERHDIWPIPYFSHLGKRGGYARNQALVNIARAFQQLGSAVLVLAFASKADFETPTGWPKGGTWHCIARALVAGLHVRAWDINGNEPWKEKLSERRTRDSCSAS